MVLALQNITVNRDLDWVGKGESVDEREDIQEPLVNKLIEKGIK